MAKQIKALPARRQRDGSRVDESVLLRSAETLGRVIGTLHRQIDGVTNRFASQDAMDPPDAVDDVTPAKNGTVPRRRKTVRASAGMRASTVTRPRVDEPRKAKRAAKTASSRKSASGGRASARKATAKKAARHR
jgi:hypothetical protein